MLEIQSAKLLPVWKIYGKNNYMQFQCEYMEWFFDDEVLSPVCRGIMRANSFCVKSSGRGVAFDKQNEHYNLRLKNTPVAPLLDLAIVQSLHAILGVKAAKELWGLPKMACWKD
jgi:hypothetical protein